MRDHRGPDRFPRRCNLKVFPAVKSAGHNCKIPVKQDGLQLHPDCPRCGRVPNRSLLPLKINKKGGAITKRRDLNTIAKNLDINYKNYKTKNSLLKKINSRTRHVTMKGRK